jgi:hypothetical protein
VLLEELAWSDRIDWDRDALLACTLVSLGFLG